MEQHTDKTEQAGRFDFHFQLKCISDKIRVASDETFAEYGLTGPQAGCIHYIHAAGGSMSQRELEKRTDVSHPTIVGIVARLQEKGFVRVETDRTDRRKRIITLTEKAENVSDQLAKSSDELNDILVKGLSGPEKAELSRLLKAVDQNLDLLLGRSEDPAEPSAYRKRSNLSG